MYKLLYVNGYRIGNANNKAEVKLKYPNAVSIDEGAFTISVIICPKQ